MSKEIKFSIATLIISVLITGSLTFLISQQLLKPSESTTFIPEENDNTTEVNQNEELKYFRDRLTLTNQDATENPWIVEIDLSRKEQSKNRFVHYYNATLFQDGKQQTIKTNFYSKNPEIKAGQFLQKFENKIFDDLSTRETYTLSMEIEGKKIDIELENIDGDFITKNDITYTRYLSAGNANITIDGQSFKANAALEKAYSSDHSKYVFFPGLEKLKSRTYRFLIWDEDHNFYLLDNSTVSEENPYYRPHTWILYKNFAPEYTQKVFAADIEFTETDAEKNWDVSVPELNMDWHLSTTDTSESVWYDGVISGTISKTSDTGTTEEKVFGLFSLKSE